jgi:hypothetical protein
MVATRKRVQVPTLINVHCIAHYKALDVEDATRNHMEFQMLDCFANTIYEWVGHSTNSHNEPIYDCWEI